MQKEPLNILWVKSGPLFPLDSGGKKRTHATLEEISRRHHVTYLALLAEGQDLHKDEASAPYAAEKVWLPWRETPKGTWRFYRDLLRNFVFSPYPYALEKYCSRDMMDWLRREISKDRFDLVICDFLTPAPNFNDLKCKAPMILFQHNMEALIWKRLAESSPGLIGRFYLRDQFRRYSKWEEKLSRLFDGVITVSEDDSQYARRNYHLDNVRGHVATGVDVDYFAPRKEIGSAADIIGFLGSMDWMANIQAVEYFVAEAYPMIKLSIPGVRFMVIGRNPPESILKLAMHDESIVVTGSVVDVRPYLKMCDLMVVPLLAGGGTRIKILEAMAMGVPVVSTTIGAEGLDLESGIHLEIADGASRLAACTAELLLNDSRRQALANAAYTRVVRENGWKTVVDKFLRLCRRG
jgi:glycosyltransferase involved in cell wall biosynthesis